MGRPSARFSSGASAMGGLPHTMRRVNAIPSGGVYNPACVYTSYSTPHQRAPFALYRLYELSIWVHHLPTSIDTKRSNQFSCDVIVLMPNLEGHKIHKVHDSRNTHASDISGGGGKFEIIEYYINYHEVQVRSVG